MMLSDEIQSQIIRIEEAFIDNYITAQYYWVQFLSEHIADSSRQFGGDLQMMLILAVIGQCVLAQIRGGDFGVTGPEEPAGISATRLADITGIPRQTVRRKLMALAGKGWIVQKGDGSWVIAFDDQGARAARDLNDLDRRGIQRIARLTAQLWALGADTQAERRSESLVAVPGDHAR